jgi:hypothetical protein
VPVEERSTSAALVTTRDQASASSVGLGAAEGTFQTRLSVIALQSLYNQTRSG